MGAGFPEKCEHGEFYGTYCPKCDASPPPSGQGKTAEAREVLAEAHAKRWGRSATDHDREIADMQMAALAAANIRLTPGVAGVSPLVPDDWIAAAAESIAFCTVLREAAAKQAAEAALATYLRLTTAAAQPGAEGGVTADLLAAQASDAACTLYPDNPAAREAYMAGASVNAEVIESLRREVARLSEERDALERENEEWRTESHPWVNHEGGDSDSMTPAMVRKFTDDALEQAEAALEKAREAFRKYAVHKGGCPVVTEFWDAATLRCTCGYDTALTTPPSPAAKGAHVHSADSADDLCQTCGADFQHGAGES